MTASDSSAPVTESRKVRAWLTVLGAGFVAAFFLFFTWRGLLVYFTGDDLIWSEALPVGNGRLGAMVFGELKLSACN